MVKQVFADEFASFHQSKTWKRSRNYNCVYIFKPPHQMLGRGEWSTTSSGLFNPLKERRCLLSVSLGGPPQQVLDITEEKIASCPSKFVCVLI
jgi:hypothetical protein